MRDPRAGGFCGAISLVLLVVIWCGERARAQPRWEEASAPAREQSPSQNPDFFFGRPRGWVGLHGSWLFARAGSDLFEFVGHHLTLEKRDFSQPVIGAELAATIAPRLDALFGVDVSQVSVVSEYRDYLDPNDLPISQTSVFSQLNLSGSVRVALAPRGREVSRFAWIPRRITPYVGGGAGYLWYEFKQAGEFVDFIDLSIFRDTFESAGWTPSAHVFGGADVQAWRRLYLTLEARYLWADAELDRDFAGFDPLDLAGLKVTSGVQVVF